jgi:predicted amidohydrolase
MRVGFIQMEPKILDVRTNVERALGFLRQMKADLIVLPELFNTGYVFQSREELAKVAEEIPGGSTTKSLQAYSRKTGTVIVAGIAEKRRGKFYNAAAYIRGDMVKVYHKVHLFFHEKDFFEPGDKFSVWDGVGVMICFDWFFPEAARTLMLKGARLLAHPANLVLPHCPNSMVVRCIENRIFAVTANRIGKERGLEFIGLSEIVDPNGNILYRASRDKEESHVEEINLDVAKDKDITELNNIMKDRRPDCYRL